MELQEYLRSDLEYESSPNTDRDMFLFRWKHHQTQHSGKESDGVNKEPCNSWDTRTGDNWNCFTKEAVHNSEGLRIGKNEEHEGGIEAVFDFQKESIPRKGTRILR